MPINPVQSLALSSVIYARALMRENDTDAFEDTLTGGELVKTAHAFLGSPAPHSRGNLVTCAAMVLAEIERMDRGSIDPDQVPMFAPVSA